MLHWGWGLCRVGARPVWLLGLLDAVHSNSEPGVPALVGQQGVARMQP